SCQPIPPPQPEGGPDERAQTTASPPSEIETAQLAVAERIARILERSERAIAEQQSSSAAYATPPRPFDTVTPRPAHAVRSRPLIDDTETFDPGRDPAAIFAEAEQNARVVEN